MAENFRRRAYTPVIYCWRFCKYFTATVHQVYKLNTLYSLYTAGFLSFCNSIAAAAGSLLVGYTCRLEYMDQQTMTRRRRYLHRQYVFLI